MFRLFPLISDAQPGLPPGDRRAQYSRKHAPTLVLLLCCGLSLLAGCASSGLSDGDYTNEAFQAGEIRLTCGFACSRSWSVNRQTAREYYEDEYWQGLARLVSDVGYASDLGYYYLGRAAEGTGYSVAALEYYQLAQAEAKQCGPDPDRCGGLDVAALVKERMAALEEARAEAASKRSQPVVRDKQLMAAQAVLVDLGYSAGRPDGLYGPKTQAALTAFQQHRGLPQTGILDAATLAALKNPQAGAPQPGEGAKLEGLASGQGAAQDTDRNVSEPAAGAGSAGVQPGNLVVSATDLMDAPDIFSNVIRAVPKGRRVTVISREADWYKVAYDGDVGYIYADYIK